MSMTMPPASGCMPSAQPERQRVLVFYTGNSARSQMAEALLRHEAGGRFEIFSAGISPKGIHPLTVEFMKTYG